MATTLAAGVLVGNMLHERSLLYLGIAFLVVELCTIIGHAAEQ